MTMDCKDVKLVTSLIICYACNIVNRNTITNTAKNVCQKKFNSDINDLEFLLLKLLYIF